MLSHVVTLVTALACVALPTPSRHAQSPQKSKDDDASQVDGISRELKALKSQFDKVERENDRLRGLELALNEEKGERQERDSRLLEERIIRVREQATNEAKKEAAWEIAKAREQTASAREEVKRVRTAAAAERKKLLARLKRIEAKFRAADGQPRRGSDESTGNGPENGTGEKTDRPEKMSLAQLAERKRLQRERAEAKAIATARKPKLNKAKAPPAPINPGKPTQPKHPGLEMDNQLERSVSKIKKRFADKIELVRDAGDADLQIRKLRKEMAIQIETLEARFKNRPRRDD